MLFQALVFSGKRNYTMEKLNTMSFLEHVNGIPCLKVIKQLCLKYLVVMIYNHLACFLTGYGKMSVVLHLPCFLAVFNDKKYWTILANVRSLVCVSGKAVEGQCA